MSFVPNFPPSLLSRVGEEKTGETTVAKRNKEDYKKMKALEEARKSAAVPAMQDESGNEINPHIPQYIMQAPWYFGSLQPTLRHQRLQHEDLREASYMSGTGLNSASLAGFEVKELRDGPKAKRWRAGACENCGAMGHKKKECLEAPKKIGARFSGRVLASDHVREKKEGQEEMGYDAKRDRYKGYDPSAHKETVARYEALEEVRKATRAKRMEETGTVHDEHKYDESEMDMPGQKFDAKARLSIRNLRIREDTAKYLHNLNLNSAYYDAKTRSMRENPFADSGKGPDEVPFAGDNFVRHAGGATTMLKDQMFAWEMATEHGLNVNLQADPTQVELLSRRVGQAEKRKHLEVREELLERYGGEEHLESMPPELLLGQSELYVEYSNTGQIIKGPEMEKVRSQYEEDMFPGNHTSVWGSYYLKGRWGYACCHAMEKAAYCLGEKGKDEEEEEGGPAAGGDGDKKDI